MSKLRVIFAGTPDFAATCLQHLLKSDHEVVAVYSQPDRPAGRGKKLQPSPVKQLALDHNIPVEQPINFKDPESIDTLHHYQADLMIVVAYGLLLPKAVLDAPRLGCINVHASLLPRWRGAAPIQRAIEAGDTQTGVGIMQMEEGLDTGPVWHEVRIPIAEDETGASLHDKLAELGGKALLETLPIIIAGNQHPEPQSEQGITYAHKLQKQEAQIDWTLAAMDIERKIRAFNSWPVSFFRIGNDPVRVWHAQALHQAHNLAAGSVIEAGKSGITVACGAGILRLVELQPAGSRRMTAAELLNSKAHWFQTGKIIGSE